MEKNIGIIFKKSTKRNVKDFINRIIETIIQN